MMRRIKENKALHILYKMIEFLLFLFLIIYLIFVVFQRVSNNSSIAGYRLFTIASESMFPTYKIGDVILIKETPVTKLNVGDDVTYQGQRGNLIDKIVTHRIIKIEENGTITTQGIANQYADPTITSSQLYGKVVYRLFFMTILNKVILNKFGFYFLIFVPLVMLIFMEIIDTISDMKHSKEKHEDEENDKKS